MLAFLQRVGRFIGVVLAGIFQGAVALMGDAHRALHRHFGQRVWIGYLVGALLLSGYLTGRLMVVILQLLMILQQFFLIAIIIFGLMVVLGRYRIGGHGGGHH